MTNVKKYFVKLILIFAATLSFSQMTFALPPPKAPLFKLENNSGFRPVMQSVTLTIFTTGEVEREIRTQNNKTVENLATLSPSSINRLRFKLRTFPQSPLLDLQAGTPICMDAPSTQYYFYPTSLPDQQPIEFKAFKGCHTFMIKATDTEYFANLLNTLQTL